MTETVYKTTVCNLLNVSFKKLLYLETLLYTSLLSVEIQGCRLLLYNICCEEGTVDRTVDGYWVLYCLFITERRELLIIPLVGGRRRV